MAIIFEDSAKVTKKQIPIPQNAKNVFKAMKKIYEPYLDKNIAGSKILKSLGSDKKYNKKGVNSKQNGDDIKQDSVNVADAKMRLHRMNKLPKNSIQYQLNGGELAANIYRKGIERARGTKEVEAVKPPKPTTNASLKPSDISSETIKTPNGKISYTVTTENVNKQRKKIYLSEEAINKLLEYYTQLKIPFNDTSGKGYDDKFNYEHFIDWMEYVGRYGMLPNSNVDKNQLASIIYENIPNAFENYLDSDVEDSNYLYGILDAIKYLYIRCESEDDLRMIFNLPEEFYQEPPSNIIDFINYNGINEEDADELKDMLTDEGIERFNKYMRDYFVDTYTDNGIPDALTINDRGLIYIEREITVPNVLSTDIPRNIISNETDEYNYFELLRNSFDGLGNCWTWKKGYGEAYCGSYYKNGTVVLLQGWVDPRNVNWEETLVRNAYSLSEEKEIFIDSGKIVEIDKVTVNDNSDGNYGKNILNKPILIQT